MVAYSSRVEGALDKTPRGIVFTSITIAVDLVVGGEDAARAGELLRKAKQHCIVANALSVPVALVASVKTASPVPA